MGPKGSADQGASCMPSCQQHGWCIQISHMQIASSLLRDNVMLPSASFHRCPRGAIWEERKTPPKEPTKGGLSWGGSFRIWAVRPLKAGRRIWGHHIEVGAQGSHLTLAALAGVVRMGELLAVAVEALVVEALVASGAAGTLGGGTAEAAKTPGMRETLGPPLNFQWLSAHCPPSGETQHCSTPVASIVRWGAYK